MSMLWPQLAAAAFRIEPRADYLTVFVLLVLLGAVFVFVVIPRLKWRKRRAVPEVRFAEPAQPPRRGTRALWLGSPIVTVTLAVALVLMMVVLLPTASSSRLPGNQQGYEPAQPIHFSHRLHAGELEIDCQYCHSGAERSRHAGIPAVATCMNCHKFVTAPLAQARAEDELAAKEKRAPRRVVSAELRKLYDAAGLDADLKPTRAAQPLVWNKVHNLADFAYFDHRPHVTSGVTCQSCHGPVETMERVRQVNDLSMGWCVNCHRAPEKTAGVLARPVKASLDCSSCHY